MKTLLNLKGLTSILLILFFSCKSDLDNMSNEIASISNLEISSPETFVCELPCTPTFTANSNLAFPENPGDIVNYIWNFGDGSIEVEGEKVMHQYEEEGQYTITLKATAPGAAEVSLSEEFNVNPKSSFIATVPESLIGMDAQEVSDGYLVFGLYKVTKITKQGMIERTVDMRNRLDLGYIWGDYHNISEDKMLIVGNNGCSIEVDNNLNFSNNTGVTCAQYQVSAVVTKNTDLFGMGFLFQEGFVSPQILNPIGDPQEPTPNPNYTPSGYFFLGGEQVPDLIEKHIQIDNSFFMPLGAFNMYGNSDAGEWIERLELFNAHSMTDGENNNLVALGIDFASNSMILQEVNKSNGALGNSFRLCDDKSIPGGIEKVEDGYVVASIIENNSDCLNGRTLDGDRDVRLTKYNFDYEIIWDNIIVTSQQASRESVRNLKQVADGGFLVMGTHYIGGTAELFLLKANSQGLID